MLETIVDVPASATTTWTADEVSEIVASAVDLQNISLSPDNSSPKYYNYCAVESKMSVVVAETEENVSCPLSKASTKKSLIMSANVK